MNERTTSSTNPSGAATAVGRQRTLTESAEARGRDQIGDHLRHSSRRATAIRPATVPPPPTLRDAMPTTSTTHRSVLLLTLPAHVALSTSASGRSPFFCWMETAQPLRLRTFASASTSSLSALVAAAVRTRGKTKQHIVVTISRQRNGNTISGQFTATAVAMAPVGRSVHPELRSVYTYM